MNGQNFFDDLNTNNTQLKKLIYEFIHILNLFSWASWYSHYAIRIRNENGLDENIVIVMIYRFDGYPKIVCCLVCLFCFHEKSKDKHEKF